MRISAHWARTVASALALLGLHTAGAHGSRPASQAAVTAGTEVCEFRTINYIIHTLPQQCLRTSWTNSAPTVTEHSAVQPTITAIEATVTESSGSAQDNGTTQEQDTQEELAASSFMSFEEWKEMMLRKSGQDPSNVKNHKPREHRDRDPTANHADADSFGEDGEISLDFDALAEKVSEITASAGEAVPKATQAVKEEQVFYDDGKTQYYRSKDAGKTCKERFSYASFDAGATVLKTSPGAKNAKAILIENKDSYMLLECRTKNKFVIVELSDDILVDTVVIANFEFFSSMIRKFRVSVSDRYPVKLEKWVDLGTFEARNSRDIQAFLIEHPQIYTKYIRLEFLSHWGNEFYCPVSLVRVHGTRMLDTWKEPSHDDEPEQIEASAQETIPETPQAQEPASTERASTVATDQPASSTVAEVGLTPWQPFFHGNFSLQLCELRSPTTADPTPVESGSEKPHKQPPVGAGDSVTPRPSAGAAAEERHQANGSSAEPASAEPHASGQTTTAAPVASSAPPQAGINSTASNAGQKPADGRADSAANSTSTTTPTSRNKTTSVSSASASPTVQESFFKTISKRLQVLESNTSLSLQYIEEQSRFLQEVLLKMERKQITRVDSFLDTLNNTVLSELRNVRTQYDQIWQSTVLALESQREQSQREVVALTSRLNILADEVVFQKRMAILQSLLLLACLLLVIFSRGGFAGIDSATFPALPQSSSAYRRFGYSYGHARSDSGVSILGSSPQDTQQTMGTDSHLAASALPRHLYPTGSSSSVSFKDKTLPLTPPSEYSRESTPAATRSRHVNHSPESSFYEQLDGADVVDTPPRQQAQDGTGETGAQPLSEGRDPFTMNAKTSSIETDGDPPQDDGTPPPEELPSTDSTRPSPTHTVSAPMPPASSQQHQPGGLKKPLPALPEDPN